MNILSKYLKTMQDKKYSISISWEILQITANTENPQEAARIAIDIINHTATEQEALEKIRAKFQKD